MHFRHFPTLSARPTLRNPPASSFNSLLFPLCRITSPMILLYHWACDPAERSKPCFSEWKILEHDEIDEMRQEETYLVFNATIKAWFSSSKMVRWISKSKIFYPCSKVVTVLGILVYLLENVGPTKMSSLKATALPALHSTARLAWFARDKTKDWAGDGLRMLIKNIKNWNQNRSVLTLPSAVCTALPVSSVCRDNLRAGHTANAGSASHHGSITIPGWRCDLSGVNMQNEDHWKTWNLSKWRR
jgi:hypothetical protein